MIVIENDIIPLKGYAAVAIWPFVFVRSGYAKDDPAKYGRMLNHEGIHGRQQLELLVVFFYLWYLVEWLYRSVEYGSWKKGYRNISFEREAYANEGDMCYLESRKWYSWFRYL